jgi:cell division protein FtsI (penicillin-binding protein 3)
VVIDRPKGDGYGGGAAAAPVYSRITDGVLRLRNQRPQVEEEIPAQLASFGGGQ